jgi:hypothetical protein
MRTRSIVPILVASGALACTVTVQSGESTVAATTPAAAPSSFDWCEWLQNKPGQLYKNKENPYVQSFQIGGRLQYQAAYLDGNDVNGNDYHTTHEDFRRVRLESKIDFLQYFGANIKLNMVNDQRRSGGELDWGYSDFDEAVFSFDIGKAFGTGPFDSLKLNYGRFKFNMTEEVHMSSKEIYTIERSAIANKLYGANNRPSGVTLDAGIGKWSATAGVFSSEDDSDFIGGWSGGQAYYLSVAHETTDEWRFVVDSVVNDADEGGDDFLGYDWATALNAIYSKERFGAVGTLVFGENNEGGSRDGSFHAVMLMPYYWVVEDRLQAVLQYQYAGSGESEGIRTNSRYVRSENPAGINVNSGRGDELHTLYAGLNYHICGDNLKIMGGVEYSNLNTPSGDADALTWLVGFRTFF